MNIVDAYRAINQSTLELLKSTSKLSSPILKEEKTFARLEESPFVLTEETKKTYKSVVNAHKIQQYRVQFHSVRLRENVDSWFLDLLRIDEGEGL